MYSVMPACHTLCVLEGPIFKWFSPNDKCNHFICKRGNLESYQVSPEIDLAWYSQRISRQTDNRYPGQNFQCSPIGNMIRDNDKNDAFRGRG